jgi:hypothetical protein
MLSLNSFAKLIVVSPVRYGRGEADALGYLRQWMHHSLRVTASPLSPTELLPERYETGG